MTTATQTNTQGRNTYPSSFRFREKTHNRLNHYAKVLKRKKSSLVEEALEKLFDEEEKREKEILELRRLVQEGRDSGEPIELPSAEEIKALAKKRYPHNH